MTQTQRQQLIKMHEQWLENGKAHIKMMKARKGYWSNSSDEEIMYDMADYKVAIKEDYYALKLLKSDNYESFDMSNILF